MAEKIFDQVAVVGMHFREKEGVPAKSIVSNFIPPTSLDLEREPTNQFDSFALKAFYNGQHIGYIEASQAAFISPFIDQGWKVKYCTVCDLEPRRNNLHPICTVALVNEEEEEPVERTAEITAD